MTPKEKAKELVDKYYNRIESMEGEERVTMPLARECALIAVDEIMEAIGWDEILPQDKDNYWPEVKQEIEKL